VCAVLAGSLGLEAFAEETSRVVLTPSVTVSQSFDSDPVVLEDGEESDSVFEVIPAFRARAERPGTQLDLDVSTRTRSSSADSDLAALDETASFSLRQSLSERFSAIATGSFRSRDAQDPLDRDGVEIQVGRPDLNEASGDLTLAYSVSATSQVSVGYSAFARDFQGGESSRNGNRDVDVDAYSLGYSVQMSPLDRLGLSLSYQQLHFGNFDSGPFRRDDQDDDVTALFASWTRQLTPMWTADLTGGVRRLKTNGGGFRGLVSAVGDGAPDDESTGFIGGLALQRQTEWNRTRIAYRRETRPQGGIGTSLDVDSFELSFKQQLLRSLSFELRGDYQISKSASDAFFPTPAFLVQDPSFPVAVPVCLDSVPASFDGVGGCLARGSSSVDTNLLRLGAELNWRWTRGFATFLSFDFRDQETDGLLGGRDRNTSRVRLGFRYAYDYEVF
jgi:hypothetical protein